MISSQFLVRWLSVAAVLLIGVSCHQAKKPATAAMYYWRTHLHLDQHDTDAFDSLGVHTLYLRLFDVVWDKANQMATPAGEVDTRHDNNVLPAHVLPVVYLTTEALSNTPAKELPLLATHIADKIKEHWKDIAAKSNPSGVPEEVQIDCDWTESLKGPYFQLLELLKAKFPGTVLSCTVRLWQYKYAKKAGVPPVDRGLLMCYNMASPKEYSTGSTIADEKLLSQYLSGEHYALPLDIALPIFNWGVWYQRHEFKGLLGNMDEAKIKADTVHYIPDGEAHHYRFNKDTVIGTSYIRYGDQLHIDNVPPAAIDKMIALLDTRLTNESRKIVFFHWEPSLVHNTGIAQLSSWYQALHCKAPEKGK